MSGRGLSFNQPTLKVLMNSPSPNDLGMYTDTNTGQRVLHFLREGISLPFVTGSTIRVQRNRPHVARSVAVTLSNIPPADLTRYEVGFNVTGFHQNPGVDNDMFTERRSYYGVPIFNVPVTAGVIDAAALTDAAARIVALINAEAARQVRSVDLHPVPYVTATSSGAVITLVQRIPDVSFRVGIEPNIGTQTVTVQGSFEFLPTWEVQQDFSHIPNLGLLAQEVNLPNRVNPSLAYAKFFIDVPIEGFVDHGASQIGRTMATVALYVPITEATVNRWAALAGGNMMATGTLASLLGVLGAWLGTAVTIPA